MKSDLTAMQRHTHPVTGQRRGHSGRITDEQQVILHLGPFLEADLGDRNRLRKKKDRRRKDLFKKGILSDNVLFHFRDGIPASP